MTLQPLTPTRKKLLEVYIKCIKRTERRILLAHHVVTGKTYCPDYTPVTGRKFIHICDAIRASGMERHAMALMKLRLARSKFAAELEGLLW